MRLRPGAAEPEDDGRDADDQCDAPDDRHAAYYRAPSSPAQTRNPGCSFGGAGACVGQWRMPLSAHPLRASVAVSDIRRAVAFYEGRLGLRALQSGPSAHIAGGSRIYGSGGGPALHVYQSGTAGQTAATLATWYVDDLDQIVGELA